MTALENAKRIIKIGRTAEKKFADLRDLCYQDDNERVDDLHDELYYQQLGLSESLYGAIEEWNEYKDIDAFEGEFKDALALANDIERYMKGEEIELNWIYA